MDVSIIIVNYHTSGLIADCLNSIVELTHGIDYEMIIVDNNSEPDIEDLIRIKTGLKETTNLHFLALPENIGFGRANNEGLKIAKGRNILFLNPDTILLNNAIKILSDFLDQHQDAGACGGNLYDAVMQPTQSFKRVLPGIREDIDELLNLTIQKALYGKSRRFNYTTGPLEVGFITGADLMVKTEVLKKTGDFSPEFFMYYEETDLCCRIKRAGYKIYSVPEAKIQHLEGKSIEETEEYQSEFKTSLLEKSRHIYLKRNMSNLERKVANIFYDLFLLSRIGLVKNPRKKEYYRQRRKYFLSSR